MSQKPNIRDVWDFNNPAQSEDKFRSMMQVYAEEPDYHLELKTQIARTLGLRRRFDDAHAVLDEVEGALTDETPKARIRYHLERGRTFNSSNQKDKARPHFLQAVELAKAQNEEFLHIDALHMMGIVDTGEDSLDWNMEAIQAAETAGDPHARGWLGSLLNNTAWTLHDLGRYDEALDLFQRAVEFRESKGDPKTIRIAKYSVAKCLRSMGHVELALAQQQELVDEEGDGFVQEEIGECLLALGRETEAAPHFKKAYEQLSQDEWLKAEEPERLERIRRFAGGS